MKVTTQFIIRKSNRVLINLSDNIKMPDGVYVKGFVEGVDVIFIADTGACKTVLSEKIFKKIPLLQRPKLRKTSPLTGASGESVKLLGKANFNIMLASLEIVAEIVVANIEDQCLLGIDILQGQQDGPADILLSKGVIHLKGVSIPCIQVKKSEIIIKVTAADHFIIPGYCEAVIDVYIESNKNDELLAPKEFIIEPSEEFIANNKIAMAALVGLNPSSEEVSIKLDTIIGKASSFRKVISSLKDMENADETENFSAVRRLRFSSPKISKHDVIKNVKEDNLRVPSHLTELLDSCSEDLSTDEKGNNVSNA